MSKLSFSIFFVLFLIPSMLVMCLFNCIQPAAELIREIAVLESEVARLEKYLLSSYRKAFDQQSSCLSSPIRDDKLKSPMYAKVRRCLEFSKSYTRVRRQNSCAQPDRQSVSNPWKETTSTTEDKVRESGVHRSRSSLTQHSDLSKRVSTAEEIPGKALRACQSQPSSMTEVCCMRDKFLLHFRKRGMIRYLLLHLSML